ncbi:DUF4114 domain-containing protein [Myxococcus qinghaiensis]|uniref:DUF4114 domain-containing protein n=1 Tax=Myxococcus qinghaiensis TaxID=2906758 RepID=UPI0020A70D52|nr:DUF4114 domain-containing protein [Myxococcus qinghaiensis]MCP3167979.1 DUF4114 domain-containing protein [Myxococcus qinghaiensis]
MKVSVTNAHGLTSEATFSFTVGGDRDVDRQPPFAEGQFESLDNVHFSGNSTLRHPEPRPNPVTAEQVVFSSDVDLSLSFLSTYALASHSLGWLYYDDLVARGYVETRGTPDSSDDLLKDANNNGITDLHEDLYNLAPPFDLWARPYIGTTRRCSRYFVSGGLPYSEPELAMNGSCASAFTREVSLPDARPGRLNDLIPVDVVGALAAAQNPAAAFSDGGLFPRIPNLLEPAAPGNRHMGLGHLAFLLTDDDSDRTTYKQLGPVQDRDEFFEDGLPDYDVSAYTPDGVLRTTNPDPGITPLDRTVKLGRIQGGREIVFFLVTYYDARHDPAGDGTVYPCLKKALDGRCTLHLKTSTSVFFSKPGWNLDQDTRITTPVVEHNQGCSFDPRCNPIRPQLYSCQVASTGQSLCGWLQPPSLERLRTPAYGNLVPPKERSWVPRASNGNMPHLEVGLATPSQDQWLLGFEDLNGGGDRDFANVVFLLKAVAIPGIARSHVINDTPPAMDSHCAISRVRFRKHDWIPSWCSPSSTGDSITYAVASDCDVCSEGVCQTNPTPTWVSVPFAPGLNEAVMDLSWLGGSQLCWKAQMTKPDFLCHLEIFNVDIGYELGLVP